jgi:hypothetical protein
MLRSSQKYILIIRKPLDTCGFVLEGGALTVILLDIGLSFIFFLEIGFL